MMQSENINIFWSYLIVEELIRNGIDYFCISPGSRSTPLTVAAARHPQVQKKIFYDERAAAYHALGYARASGKPAVLICTSGTAAANYLPAIIEARNDHIPLVILTADRPAELLQTMANQTIEQSNIFGENVKWHFTMPTPDEKIMPQMVLTTVDLMVSKAVGETKGAVQLNCMFREPLEPKIITIDEKYLSSLAEWQKSKQPFTHYLRTSRGVDDGIVEEVIKIIRNSKRGLIVLGRLPLATELNELLEALQWPVFADITSACRSIDRPYMIQNFDHLLLDEKFNPDTIIQLGAQFVSKRLLKMAAKNRPENYIVVEESSDRIDAEHTVSMRICADVRQFSKALLPKITPAKKSSWFDKIKSAELKVGKLIANELSRESRLTESAISKLISENILEQNALFLANSMPVRDMNSFAAANSALRRVAANRGASGIDGIMASASGFACGLKRTTVLLIGDLSFLHDLNSLHLIKNSNFPVIVILLNNQGGGIFRFLPVSQHEEVFDDNFLTPHNYTFEKSAQQFDLPYYFVDNGESFITVFSKIQQENRSAIVEVKTDSELNYKFHLRLNELVKEFLK